MDIDKTAGVSIGRATAAVPRGRSGKAITQGNKKPFYSQGLTDAEAEDSSALYGDNSLTRRKKAGFLRQLLSNFNDPIIRILIGALIINALVSLGRINLPETLGIAAAILIATLVSTVSEYGSSLAFERLCRSADENECSVIRGGEIRKISISQIVVGDRIILSAGMKIPADGILTRGDLRCDQSALTGESAERKKSADTSGFFYPQAINWSPDSASQMLRGSVICSGEGEMIALRIGDDTFLGQVAGSLQDEGRPSPLKLRLSGLARSVSYLGYVGAAMIAFAYLFNSFVIDSGMDLALMQVRLQDKVFLISEIIRAVTVAVSVIVVAVPEGLPMMITVVLSSNMKKMMSHGVLVRKLVGIETAGSLNILFTDKTGTLTTGQMSVFALHSPFAVNYSNLPVDKCIAFCCSPGASSATEAALLRFAPGCQKKNVPSKRLPFNSDRKYSAALNSGVSYFIGAPEKLTAYCTSFHSDRGEALLESGDYARLAEMLDALTRRGSRVVCLCSGDSEAFRLAAEESAPSGLCFLAFAEIRDPVRDSVPGSVSDAKAAGIHVVMITGDNPGTASAVAAECGIIDSEHSAVLSAAQLHGMNDKEVLAVLPRLAVVSRALPGDKIRLVRLAEQSGLVVGMTGDGINDAPALKAADVGFAMGSGTDIAREAGDIVITDDSFSSIARAVLYGRTIFESIRKFVVFQLMMNFSAMGVSLFGPFMGIDSPVTVIQMLWVNIIMDTLGGLAFAGEPALRRYMLRPSVPRNEPIISRGMLNQIIITGLYTLALSIFFLKSEYLRSLLGGNEKYYLTAFFAMFIFCGIFNSFNARVSSINLASHIAANKPFVAIMSAVAIIQLMIIYFGGDTFRCVPLTPRALLFTAFLALTVIPADILRKLVFSKRKKR